jgi:predicted nucleic acid-binding protein
MAVKVVDASALAALLFGEPGAQTIVDRLGDARLVAPSLLGFELANVCLSKCRRQPEEEHPLKAAFRLRARLSVEEVAVDYDQVVELAAETGLTAYDASYLWVARQVGGELVTLDKRLAQVSAAT